MKFILMALMAIPVAVFPQDMRFTVSANNKTLTVSPDDENTDTVFEIEKTQYGNSSLLTIRVANEEIDKDWKRSFSIYDKDDNAIKDFTLMKDGSYCIKMNELVTQLHQQQEYFIYTTALPKDPKKAMLVKIARRPVCRIRIL